MFCLKVISTCNLLSLLSVIQFTNVTLCFAWSYFNLQFALITYFIFPQLFILFIVQTANSKYESWWKLLMEVYQWINMIIMVILFPRVTLCFAWKLFQLAIYSHYFRSSNLKNVTLCFAWSYFNLPFRSYIQISYVLNFSSYLLYKLQIQSYKVGESY